MGAITSWVEVPPGQWSVGAVVGRRFGWAIGRIEALRRRPRWAVERTAGRTKRCRPEAVRWVMLKRGMMREPDATDRIIDAYLYGRVRNCLGGRGIRHIRKDAGFGTLGVPRRHPYLAPGS
jgi:hypothetical protein